MIATRKIIVLLAAISSLTVLATMSTVSFSQQQQFGFQSNQTVTNATGGSDNRTSTADNTTLTSGNATNQTTGVSNRTIIEQRIAQGQEFRENMTSGNIKVTMVTVSRQPDVPAELEQRDMDPLGLIRLEDGITMRMDQPSYASGENLTSTLYTGGRLSFTFDNLAIQPPDDIDVLFISGAADEMRSPIVIDDTGEDNSFIIPSTLDNGDSYYVLVSMHFPDLRQDVLMGITGKAVELQQEE